MILNLKPIDVIGKNAAEVALGNDLLRRLIRGLYSSEKDDEPLKIYADNKESYFQMENIPLYISPIDPAPCSAGCHTAFRRGGQGAGTCRSRCGVG